MQQIPILTISVTAAGAIPAQRFVGVNNQLCGAAAAAWGVADYEASAAGKVIAVTVTGTAKVQAGAAVAAGQLVKSDAAGKAIPQAGAGAILGRARFDQANVDQFVEILLLPTVTP